MPRPTPRSAVLALALLVPAPSLAGWWALYLSPGAAGQIVFALLKVWVLALPAVWTVLVDRERLRIPPLRREGFGAALTFSALAGAGILGFYFLVGRRIVDLDFQWVDNDWKSNPLSWSRRRQDAGTSGSDAGDTRTQRSPDPQWQTDSDRIAATKNTARN